MQSCRACLAAVLALVLAARAVCLQPGALGRGVPYTLALDLCMLRHRYLASGRCGASTPPVAVCTAQRSTSSRSVQLASPSCSAVASSRSSRTMTGHSRSAGALQVLVVTGPKHSESCWT